MPGLVSCLGDLIVTGIIILFSDHVKSEIWTNEDLPHFVSVSCHMPNHMKIYCSWVQTKTTDLPTMYRTSYSVKGKFEPCEQEHIGMNECTITNPPFWSSSKILVNITEINPLGSNSTIIQIDTHELLKPDPPEDVQVLYVEGQPTQLLVKWNWPSSWAAEIMHAFPLTFLLRYRPIGSNYWSMLETENTSLKIMDALVGHLHQIQIRAQDALINHSQWSEWSHVVDARPWIGQKPWEEPTESVICCFPSFDTPFPVRTTDKSPDSSLHPNGSLGLLVLLGLFAAVMVAVLLTIIVLLWVRQRKQDNVKKQELTSMVKMKSIPI
ncbi:interleukin-11 receptor subunit alpha isoform X3 [Chanodichthys erythropterus]|uniref:interleukin-11 receptor subunit alpha isoform X3 n=1 Tax=Chanodichthys erythropterus TaxID=933992 RepID=UPI00351E0F2A